MLTSLVANFSELKANNNSEVMTLHEAIEKLLRQFGRPMTTTEIAKELNKNKWYQKKDGTQIAPFQIHGRTKNYPALFNRNGSTVSLIGQSNEIKIVPKVINEKDKPKEVTRDSSSTEKVLMNSINFKPAGTIDDSVPNEPGLYCIRITDIEKLPKPFNVHLKKRGHNIIYIGIASKNLQARFLNQELRAIGHGTFFRSIGAVLGFRPEKGSLKAKSNKNNYTFKPADEKRIINWINSNLIVNWVVFKEDFNNIETSIIQRNLPLINIAKNPLALSDLKALRAECVRIANS